MSVCSWLRRVAVAQVAWATVGASTDACKDTSGECEDASLLQQGHRRPGVPVPDVVTEVLSCLNGHFKSGVCVCYHGWAGEACHVPDEFSVDESGPESNSNGIEEEVCNSDLPKPDQAIHVDIFPYSEQSNWGINYDSWEDCAGKSQSPVAIRSFAAKKSRSKRLHQNFHALPDRWVENQGHSIQVNGNFGTLRIEGAGYEVNQFHFHTPAEHRINGKLPAMEMHIVTTVPDTGAAAVVGIFFDIGRHANKCLEPMLANPLPRVGCKRFIGVFDLGCFSKQLKGPWWNYEGSLTTPPCTEHVNWNLMQQRATISVDQYEMMRRMYPSGNNRDVQPLNNRTIVSRCGKKFWG